jgi:hypothetical protein
LAGRSRDGELRAPAAVRRAASHEEDSDHDGNSKQSRRHTTTAESKVAEHLGYPFWAIRVSGEEKN